MRSRTIGILAAGALLVTACGSGTHFANRPRPPVPVNLTVYINNARISVSPSSVGAGPVNFIITNQAQQAESLTIAPHSGSSVATTGPINPQGTAQVTVNLDSPGEYELTTGAASGSIQPAPLHIGPARPSAANQLLQP
jgi:hypothetical protein